MDVRVEQLNLNIMHRIVHEGAAGAPCYFTDSFEMVIRVHHIETRHRIFLFPCHSLGKTDRMLLNSIALSHGINYLWKIKN